VRASAQSSIDPLRRRFLEEMNSLAVVAGRWRYRYGAISSDATQVAQMLDDRISNDGCESHAARLLPRPGPCCHIGVDAEQIGDSPQELLLVDEHPAIPLEDERRHAVPDSSTTTLRQALKSDRARVNGAIERRAKRAMTGRDSVEVIGKSERPLDPRVRIVFEDSEYAE
jgi:hypothetical protein